MRYIITLTFLLFTLITWGQIQENAPWGNDPNIQRRGNLTLKEISTAAENYFSTIDKDKKGSGYKPFKRWEYNWSNFLKSDGTFSTKEDLWKAWGEKKAMNTQSFQRKTDVSNWTPLGPNMNSNTYYSATNKKQTGQGRVNAVAVDPSAPNTYYVGTPAGGIWKSIDAGVNWTPLTDELPQIGVSGIAIHPTDSNTIYIATGDDDANNSFSVGVWKSEDGGITWNNTGELQGNPITSHEIYIQPNNPETILVATSTGIQKSTNGGASWSVKLNRNIRDLKMKPGDSKTWYAVTNNFFYRSIDGGDKWTKISLPLAKNSTRLTMDVTKANNSYIYIVSAGAKSAFNGVYKSTDSGLSFTKTLTGDAFGGSTQAWYDLALTVSSFNANIVYIGVLDIFKSTNGGNSFTKINQWFDPSTPSYTHADIHFLRFINGKFFAGTDGGIFVSTDEGVSFTDLTKNLAISQFYKISVSPQNYQAIAGGAQDNGGFGYKNGIWRNYHGGDGMEGLVDFNNQNKYYGFTQYGGSLNITNDSGQNSSRSVQPPNGIKGEWVTPLTTNSEGELYSGYNQLYRLNNDSNWVKVSSHKFSTTFEDFSSENIDIIEIDPNNNNIVATNLDKLYRSTNKGVNFTQLNPNVGIITSIEIRAKF